MLASVAGAAAVSVLFAAPPEYEPAPESADCVVLLHGLGRSSASMRTLARHLRRAGYATINLDYPSTRETVQRLAVEHLAPGVQQCLDRGAPRVHFVTHSLGGIIVRQFLRTNVVPQGSRLVMLAPPNQGSELAQALKGWPLYRRTMGPAGRVLGIDADSLPRALGPVPIETGVVAGTRSFNPLFSWILPGPDDGKVSVDGTRVAAMKDFLIVRATHAFIMRRQEVVEQVAHFLRRGCFAASGGPRNAGPAESTDTRLAC